MTRTSHQEKPRRHALDFCSLSIGQNPVTQLHLTTRKFSLRFVQAHARIEVFFLRKTECKRLEDRGKGAHSVAMIYTRRVLCSDSHVQPVGPCCYYSSTFWRTRPGILCSCFRLGEHPFFEDWGQGGGFPPVELHKNGICMITLLTRSTSVVRRKVAHLRHVYSV